MEEYGSNSGFFAAGNKWELSTLGVGTGPSSLYLHIQTRLKTDLSQEHYRPTVHGYRVGKSHDAGYICCCQCVKLGGMTGTEWSAPF